MIQKKILKPFLCLLCILAILASAGCGMMGELLNVLEEEPKPTKELESTEDLTQPSREPYTLAMSSVLMSRLGNAPGSF